MVTLLNRVYNKNHMPFYILFQNIQSLIKFSFNYVSLSFAIIGMSIGIGLSILCSILFKFFKSKSEETVQSDIKNTSFVFSGNLKQTTLMEAAQFLELGKKEGILHIYCGRRKGYINFFDGKIIDAFYRDLVGKDAVIKMFEIDEGDFYFEPKKIRQPRLMNESIINLAFQWDEKRK